MNKVMMIGRLTKDPESRTAGESTTTTFTLAIDRPVGKNGEKKADFPRVVTWGKVAENCAKYLEKGRMVAIEGRLQTGSYKNKDGVTVYTTDVIASNVQFLGGGNGENKGGQQTTKPAPKPATQAVAETPTTEEVDFPDVDDDDMF